MTASGNISITTQVVTKQLGTAYDSLFEKLPLLVTPDAIKVRTVISPSSNRFHAARSLLDCIENNLS